jgi:hypothetical protein
MMYGPGILRVSYDVRGKKRQGNEKDSGKAMRIKESIREASNLSRASGYISPQVDIRIILGLP